MALLIAALVLTSCGKWQGIANVPVPGGPGTTPGSMEIKVKMADTLALNVNSRVRVADVFVGTVRGIELNNWVATLSLGVDKDVILPRNAKAKIGQTSLLGSQHVELYSPEDPSPQRLKSGDTIELDNTSAYPTTERVLASIANILSGGGVANLETIQTEVFNILNGRGDQIKTLLAQLDTFTRELNDQTADITRAIDASDRLFAIVAQNNQTLDKFLQDAPPLIKYFADSRQKFIDAIEALGRISNAADGALAPISDDLSRNLELLQNPLGELGRGAPYLIQALDFILTAPFPVSTTPKAIRGDFANISLMLDLTLSAVDTGVLTGTGFSGALRALEQSWGRDPATMVPDVRFTPNPNSAPGGPLVERGQ